MAKSKAEKAPKRAIALGSTALGVVAEVETLSIGRGLKLTVNGIQVHGQPTFGACVGALHACRVTERGAAFAIGDLVLYLEARFGEESSQVLDASEGWNLKTLNSYRWLSKSIVLANRRMDRLGIGHHILVAAKTAVDQRRWLTKAANDDADEPWTVKQLKDAMEDSGEDVDETLWLVVRCENELDRSALQATLLQQGRVVKAQTSKRVRKALKAMG